MLVFALVFVAFAVVISSASAQTTTPGVTATPGTLPTTGASDAATSTVTVVLLALGATAGLAGLLLRGLRRPL
jgi:hypothetical protein